MIVGVPDRFSPVSDVVDDAVGVPGCDGVDDLPVGENVTVPMEMRSRSPGALVMREPTMNDNPKASRALRFDAESMPASAATTIEAPFKPWRSMKLVTIGTMVVVSAVLPS